MKGTLLAVGDKKDLDSFARFCREKRCFANSGMGLRSVNYSALLRGDAPAVGAEDVVVLFFFPVVFWSRNVETGSYKGVYGNRAFYDRFRQFWTKVEKGASRALGDRRVIYVNHPRMLSWSRDRELAKKLVSKAGLHVPRTFHTRNPEEVLRLLKRGCRLFIRTRYGSAGKGISYLEEDRWMTNFRFRNGKIANRRTDAGWTFVDVTGRMGFLRELLKKDIILEEAVESLRVHGRICDLRLYLCNGKVLHGCVRTNGEDAVTTNVHHGGREEDASFEALLPPGQLETAGRDAARALRALGLGFGSVDMILSWDRKTVIFLDANPFPSFPATRRHNLGRDLIGEIVKGHLA